MMPHNMTIGKKLPIAMYVAVLSFSQADDTTKPVNWQMQIELFSDTHSCSYEWFQPLDIEHTETHSTKSR